MTEDEYIRYLVFEYKKQYPDRRVLYPVDDGCNCAGRTFVPNNVKRETNRCACFLRGVAFRRAGMYHVSNDNPRFGRLARPEEISSWRIRMKEATA
jgi:hypothetical protein